MYSAGEQEVRTALVEDRSSLMRFAGALTRDKVKAEDLYQNTCLRALKNVHQYTAGTTVKAWLFTIMRHTHLNGGRDNAAREVVGIPEEWDIAIPANGETRLAIEDVFRALAELTPAHRQILLDIAEHDESYEAMSTLYHIPIGTCKSRVSRACTALNDVMARGPATPRKRNR